MKFTHQKTVEFIIRYAGLARKFVEKSVDYLADLYKMFLKWGAESKRTT